MSTEVYVFLNCKILFDMHLINTYNLYIICSFDIYLYTIYHIQGFPKNSDNFPIIHGGICIELYNGRTRQQRYMYSVIAQFF